MEEGRYVRFAVYDQENLNLNSENTVLAELWERHVAYSQTQVRASLARCGLVPEDMDKKVGSLSGGERAKLALCVFGNEQGNVLVMDEPTNHLDLPARESLEKALKEFDGTVIFVSHDRYFISAIADRVFEIADGRLNIFEGDYTSFINSRAARQANEVRPQRSAEAESKAGYRSKKERADEVIRKQNIKRIESEISSLEDEEQALNSSLALPENSSDYKKAGEILNKISLLRQKIDELYEEYAQLIG